MNKKWVSSLIAISTVTIGSYYLGCYTERQRLLNSNERFLLHKHHWKNFELSLCGTVSAAVPTPANEVPLSASPLRVSQIMKYGFPSLDYVRSYSDFILSYDRRNRIPNWVFEHLTVESVAKNDLVDRSKCQFRPDESIHPYFQAQNSDYFHSGYDRGHMAAAGNHRLHQKHCEDTFYLSNIAPQTGTGFNRDYWNRLEMHVRKLIQTYANVYVCTGPLYLPYKEENGKKYVKYEVIGTNNVAVPTHFFKVIVGERTDDHNFEMEAYVMPNKAISDDTPLQVFQVPLESIERAAGLLLFDKLNKQQLIKVNGKKV